jgi:hypothetical protein
MKYMMKSAFGEQLLNYFFVEGRLAGTGQRKVVRNTGDMAA